MHIFLAIILSAMLCTGCSAKAKKSRHLTRADQYFEAGDYDKAKIEYMNVLRVDGVNARAIRQIGQIWWNQGSPLKAAPFWLRARELEPDNTEVRMALARLFQSVGARADAQKEAAVILKQSPQNGEALLLLFETAHTPELLAAARQQIADFPQKESAYYHIVTANLALREKDFAAAEKSISQAIAADPKLPVAHSAMGLIALLRNDAEKAREEAKVAAELSPVRSSPRIQYAQILAQTGKGEEAVNYLKELTSQARDYGPAWNLLARLAVAGKDYGQATAYLKNVLSQDGDNPEALILQAEIALGKGETQKAVEQLERLDQKYPGNSPIKYQLARAYVQNKNIEQASLALTEAVAANPNYADAILLLAQLNIGTGKAQAALQPLEELTARQPNLLPAHRALADAYRSLGRLDDAANIFRKQIAAIPNWAEPQYFLGIILRQQGKNDEARQAFNRAQELAPDNPGPLEQLVDLDVAEKRFDEASQRINAAIQKNPDSASLHFIQGKIYVAQQKWDEADASLQKAIELDPNLEVAQRLLVATYLQTGKLPAAATRLEAVVAKNPSNPNALLTLGLVYGGLKEHEKARDTYEKVLALRPDNAAVLNNLAFLYAEHFNQLDKARELAAKAREIAPSDPHVADTLGWILHQSGDYQQAAVLLREAAGALADNATVQFHYGMASYMMGAAEEARAALQRAVDSPADFEGKEDARRHLALLASGSTGEAAALSAAQLREMVKTHPNDVVALTRLGEALEKEGAHAEAAAAYEKVFQLNPKLVPPVLKLAQLYAGPLKDKAKALEFAKKARELAPNDPHATAILGAVAFAAGNFEWAYSLLQAAAPQLVNNATVQHDYAWAAYTQGKVRQAEEAMQRALAAQPDAALAEDAKRFLVLVPAERDPATLASIGPLAEEALQKDPNYVPALMVRAVRETAGNVPAAIATYETVLKQFPAFAPAQKRLATLYAQDPQTAEKAYALATNARKALPDDPELAITLALLSYQKNDYRRVIQLLEESQRQKPLAALPLFYLGMSQLQLDQKPAARASLDKALAAGLAGPQAEEAKETLSKLAAN